MHKTPKHARQCPAGAPRPVWARGIHPSVPATAKSVYRHSTQARSRITRQYAPNRYA